MIGQSDTGGGGWRRWVTTLLVLILGLGGGFALGQGIGGKKMQTPGQDLVLYERASTTFPVAGAKFTASTFDDRTGMCNKAWLKQYLRQDPRRFKAWLDLQGITEADFDMFVDRLKTHILTVGESVTNYGCYGEGKGACPFAVQSFLAPGAPMWYDPVSGRDVAKCLCSNPVKPPLCPPNCDEPTPSPTYYRTETPQTEPPVTEPPVTEPPVTQPPPTEPPRTQPPPTEQTTQKPIA